MMLTRKPGQTGTVRVIFSLPCFRARSIDVVGDFNGWRPGATPLRPCEHGWSGETELPVGCAYRYRYLVDGCRWLNDWHADHYAPNLHGGHDSVVVTLLPHDLEGVVTSCPYDGQPCLDRLHKVSQDDHGAEAEDRPQHANNESYETEGTTAHGCG